MKTGSMVLLAIAIALVFLISIFLTSNPSPPSSEGEHFTEFYILGPGGKATDYPHNLSVNQEGVITLGISNHEYRTVGYAVEVWLVNSTNAGNVLTINKLIYLDNFKVTLNHTAPNLEGNWEGQWQMPYSFSVTNPGDYKLYFVLLKDKEPSSIAQGVDYASDPNVVQKIISESSNSNTNTLSLNLNLNIG